jgi:hypothetical protein
LSYLEAVLSSTQDLNFDIGLMDLLFDFRKGDSMTTARKNVANRTNARKSTGPQTSTGKSYSSKNAVKHGFFSKHSVPEADRKDYDALLNSLGAELAPATTLEHLAIQDIVRCTRRLELADRLETRAAEGLLNETNQGGGEHSETSAPIAAWYAYSVSDLRGAKTWLKEVCEDFKSYHLLRAEWKSRFDTLFGPRFFQSLSEWNTMHYDAILMANMLAAKQRSGLVTPVPGFPEYEALPHVVDPLQNEHLKEKLLESQLQHVEDVLRSWQQGTHSNMATNSRAPDFCPRFYTTAQRDLHRAWQWHFTLMEKESAKRKNHVSRNKRISPNKPTTSH